MTFFPLTNYVIVKPLDDKELDEIEQNKKSGIILMPDREGKRSIWGKVFALGKGLIENDKRIPMTLTIGQTVVFTEYDSNEIKVEGQTYHVIRENFIFSVFKK